MIMDSKMRVLVTGGRGFIGKYLVKMMRAAGWHVFAPSSTDLDVRYTGDWDLLKDFKFNTVIHLAGKLMINSHSTQDYFDVNAIGTFNILEFCRQMGIRRLVYAMTHSDTNRCKDTIRDYGCQTYGTNSWGANNAIPFIQSKVAAADMIEAYTRQKVLDGIILRLANIRGFGSSDTKYNSPFHQFIAKAKKCEPIEVWGNPPKTYRDFVYVKDVCKAFMLAAVAPAGKNGYYNIGSGVPMTILQEVEAIIDVFTPKHHQPSTIVLRPDIQEVRTASSLFETIHARMDLGWEPEFSYRDALIDFKQEAGW